MRIGETLMDYHRALVKAFSKNVGVCLANEKKILALMEGLKLTNIQPFNRRGFCNSDILGK